VSDSTIPSSVERRTLSSQIYSILERKILTGEMLPGERISEESLAETYGVSRSPAREALADLERLGLAVRVGARDRTVTVPTEEMIIKKFDLWWIVDAGRTYLASQVAAPDHIVKLRRLVNDMGRAVKKKDVDAYKTISARFHETIRQGCPNEYVNEIFQNCDLYLRWFEALYNKEPEVSAKVVQEHSKILDAYENKDLAALSESTRAHLVRQRSRILKHFASSMIGKTAANA
jgi:DNA-binding GntR family transcriptional regulator